MSLVMNNPNQRAVILSIVACLASGAFSAQAAPLPRLRVSQNGRFFVKADGSPFFYMGDTEWGLFHLTREDAELYLKDRAAKKFTVIQAIATFWGGLDRPNAYGETVFVRGDPAHPNEAYFKHVDWVVDKAESLGLCIGMVPIWSKEYVQQDPKLLLNPSFGPTIRTAIRADGPSVVDKTSAFGYGRFLGRRYRDKPIIWILGGDWFATGNEDIWRAMAAGLAEGDGGVHLKTYHPKSPRSSSQWFQNDAWLDFNMLQTGHSILNRNYDLVAADWDRIPVKPVVDGEGGYEGIGDGASPTGKIEPADVRRIAYCGVFAGAAGYTYGANGLFGATSRPAGRGPRAGRAADGGIQDEGGPPRRGPAMPWKEAMQMPAGAQMRYLRALIESRPMLVRVPDQWLLVNDPMGTTDRIQACRASDGSYAFIYTAVGTKLRIRLVDRIYEKLSGTTIKAYWYDPRLGTSTQIEDFPKTESRTFTPPSSGHGNDWVLVLDDASRNFPAPGAK
ncbi:MAG: glycoside hydrolase family 140 protein [Bryobacteraceae bacterium]